MEKKRLLPALMAAAAAVSLAAAAGAAGEASLQGIRTKPAERELSRAEELLGELLAPDTAEAERVLSGIRKNRPEKQEEEAMGLLSAGSPRAGGFPEKNAGPGIKEPRLFYFFSFSMPGSSLRAAARESAAAGAVMVLRGLSGENFGETASRISELVGKTGAEAWIDPLLFECFSVGAAPQLVLAHGHLEGAECGGLRHVKVSGDVSLPYALGLMKKEDPHAGIFIRRLEKSGFRGD